MSRPSLRTRPLLPYAVLLMLGCRPATAVDPEACDQQRPGPSLPAAQRGSLSADGDTTSPDARLAQFARSAPGGFAGYYLEPPREPTPPGGPHPRQRVIVRLVRPEQRAEALRALDAWLRRTPYQQPRDLSDALIIRARWDFAQLYDWYQYLNRDLAATELWRDLRGSTIDETENQLHYRVRSDAVRQSVLARLAALDVPCGLVRVEAAQPWSFGGPVVQVGLGGGDFLIQYRPPERSTGQIWVGVITGTRLHHRSGAPATAAEIRPGTVLRVWTTHVVLESDPARTVADSIVIEPAG